VTYLLLAGELWPGPPLPEPPGGGGGGGAAAADIVGEYIRQVQEREEKMLYISFVVEVQEWLDAVGIDRKSKDYLVLFNYSG
jgi:hypothetical protein